MFIDRRRKRKPSSKEAIAGIACSVSTSVKQAVKVGELLSDSKITQAHGEGSFRKTPGAGLFQPISLGQVSREHQATLESMFFLEGFWIDELRQVSLICPAVVHSGGEMVISSKDYVAEAVQVFASKGLCIQVAEADMAK